ncbi:hypothetical protein L9F63_011970, partial [Diploptera punctata]
DWRSFGTYISRHLRRHINRAKIRSETKCQFNIPAWACESVFPTRCLPVRELHSSSRTDRQHACTTLRSGGHWRRN